MENEQMTIADFISKHGLRVHSTPVPFRLRADGGAETDSSWDAEAFHWLVQVSKADGSPVWRGFYSAGSGLPEYWARNGAPLYRVDSMTGKPVCDTVAARMVSGTAPGPHIGVKPVGPRAIVGPGKRRTVAEAEAWDALAARFRAAGPDPADVMDSLRSDASGTEESFEDWADGLGYETDSRSAEATYRACVDTARQLRAGLGWSAYRELMECEPE